MRRFFLFLFVTTAALACKKDDPEAQLGKIAGTWELVAREELANGEYIWKDVQPASYNMLVIRPDGQVEDINGRPPCCGPNSLSIDGNLVKIPPREKAPDSWCQTVKCGACETWEIETRENQITVSACGSSRTRYMKQD